LRRDRERRLRCLGRLILRKCRLLFLFSGSVSSTIKVCEALNIRSRRPTREDVEAMTIPHICLAAPSDNANGGIDAYEEALKQEGRIGEVETYSTMFHGWMGARAKLEDEENAKEFERG
jgi:hypothetical protein